MDGRLIFLFGVMALPACGPEPSDDPRVPDGGEPDDFASACAKLYTQQYACYYGDSLPPEYRDYISEYCAEYAREIEAELGRDCLGAMEEMFACVASLDCSVWLGDDPPEEFTTHCHDVAVEAHEICPELVGFCSSSVSAAGGSQGGADCEIMAAECLDDEEYGISCMSTSESLSCTCQRGGVDVMSVELADSCWSDDFYEAAATACGFPDGVFG